ncbi:efflux RND transporter periplasmic adaptor subunit [Symmachiella macrocystis]|nr:HlyD family efflux transporter periplasmic adaptor subunit [Symmachiella macrocystis]
MAFKIITISATISCLGLVASVAQDRNSNRRAANEADAEEAPAALVIKRRAVVLEDPRTYQIPMRLEPVRSIAVIAPVDGIVQSVHVKPGDLLPSQGDVVRMDDTRTELLTRKAKAEVTARQIERKIAGAKSGAADEVALADANLEAAKAAYELAELDQNQMIVRGAFAGTILQVHVVPGQFVRAGEAVAELADLRSLVAEIPAGRAQYKAGDKISVTVENEAVSAVVESISAPPPRFESLRPLIDSLSMAKIQIQNSEGNYHPGQAVYVDLIPTEPVAVVPALAISNSDDGQRKVQVVREYVVRDIKISPLAQINSERIYVSGEFSPNDEVIVNASMELTDGTKLRPWVQEFDAPEETEKSKKQSLPRKTKSRGL